MKKVKFLYLAVFLLGFFSSFSQNVRDLGKKSFQDVKNMNEIEPCDISSGESLSYCSEGGNRITYIFDNYILKGIMYQTAFLTRTKAEIELEKEVNDFSVRNNVKPVYSNNQALFYYPSNPLTVSYGLKEYNGTTYLIYYTFLSK